MVAYKSKMVERIRLPSREQRERNLEAAGYNLFNLSSEEVFVDLLTDSGTGAMSDAQWAALIRGDESYAGSRSFEELEEAVADVMGFSNVVPTHQGRGAENVLYGALLSAGDVVPNNTHFDTTRAHISNQDADPVDCPIDVAHDPDAEEPFKGNFSLERARAVVEEHGAERIPVVVQTITNNSAAGQAVSVENTRKVREFADEIDATFVIDACRFAENAYFVSQREEEFADASIADIAREQLGYADALVMSGKKDGLVNAGGFVATDDDALFEQCKQRAILYEGFPTYGGMAGRDVAAMAVGLREAVEDAYLEDRIEQVREFGAQLAAVGVPVYTPTSGHAVYVDAGELFPHLDAEEFPGQVLACELYREGGVRGVELGSFAFPDTDRPELVRLAVPRRTYHREHFDHVVETAEAVLEKRETVSGLQLASDPVMPEIRHFTAELEPVPSSQ
ncbi:Tryptophanase [Natrialba magadii ATCC 43099]|uniref:Tryptophanase n=1 Tax=Natrialba magadii (strain ATCC 43099 / DSM 3394 / CCM 3739 / CIP 104546 / IAM 13178 / JCM 8861 / NBRC 102185 / NCIMB 2190 / MS3) TaxID=547559 RepID=D3SVA0_NATMM|nr:tryptophanase [Natrialba magadii]ADD05508.1 Tryptophanase [Natrialba magadii ATCC 43099]ELY29529.1 tryptophanase/L-cysteine desulfhydrase, PLP-dependent [Natrialba magadii ATCC 43099]